MTPHVVKKSCQNLVVKISLSIQHIKKVNPYPPLM